MVAKEDLKGIIIMMLAFTKLNKSQGGNKNCVSAAWPMPFCKKGANIAFCY